MRRCDGKQCAIHRTVAVGDRDYDAVNQLIEEFDQQSIDQEQIINDLVNGGLQTIGYFAEYWYGQWQAPQPMDGCSSSCTFFVFSADQTGWMYLDRWELNLPWLRSSSTWGYDPQNSTLTIQSSYPYRYDLIDRTNWEIIEGEVQIRELNLDYKVVCYQSPMVILQDDRWRYLVNLQKKNHSEWIEYGSNYTVEIWVIKMDKR